MTSAPTVIIALHDGYYGCGTGAGFANFGFLETLVDFLPDDVRLALLPVWLAPSNPERQPRWHRRVRRLLARTNTVVHPVSNGTRGRDRWGTLSNFQHLVSETAQRIVDEILPDTGPFIIFAFDAPFFGLPAALPREVRAHLVLVPRSSALSHAPHDLHRISWERAGLHSGLADGTTIAAISQHMRTHLQHDYGVPRDVLRPLPDGLSNSDWLREPATTSTASPSLPDEFLLSLGRAEPYKGFDDLLDAMALLRTSGHTPPHLVLAATGETATTSDYQKSLALRARELDIATTVLTRFTPDVAGLLGHPGLRGVVVPSRAEPFGRIPMEAFAAGAAPVIATTAGGLAEQIRDGETGFTCPPRAPEALADAIARALRLDFAARAALRSRARQRALRDYNHPGGLHGFLVERAPWLSLPHRDDRLRWLTTTPPPVNTRSPVSAVHPVKVPIGPQARHWNTQQPERVVLVVVHHVTSLIRLLDIITAFDSDHRIQLVFSWNGSDPFQRGTMELLNELGMVVIPWSQAIDTEFDLAIAANHGGLSEIVAPVVVFSHGVGYAKSSPEARKPGSPEARKPGSPEARKPGSPEARSVFGLSPEWLLYNGRPIASSLVLSHDEQYERLASITPACRDIAVVAGDPCYDRMLRSRHLRDRYRAALGVRPGQTLITIATTWWQRSLLGTWPSLFREVLACLPADEYQVTALVHPNIWHGHGPWQVHTWLSDCTRAGLNIVDPSHGWQASLLAADLVIGDHGATTCYGAALQRPVLLATFPDEDVATGSAVEQLGRIAPRLDPRRPLKNQIDQAIQRYHADEYTEVRELVSSCPGESARRIRGLFYRHLDLDEPGTPPPVPIIPSDGVVVPRPEIRADHVVCTLDDERVGSAVLTRYPADVAVDRSGATRLDAAHLVVHEDHPQQSLLDEAAVLLVECPDECAARQRLADALRRHPGAVVAATATGGHSVLLERAGYQLILDASDTAALASASYSWLLTGRAWSSLPPALRVWAGPREISARVVSVAAEPLP